MTTPDPCAEIEAAFEIGSVYALEMLDYLIEEILDPDGINTNGEVSQMLILTRKPVQSIMIGNDVTVTVLGVVGNQVRIGVQAPKDVAIDREEIWLKKQQEKRAREGGGNE